MYRMDNFNDEWFIVESNERKVTYTNLNPGKYRFRVKSTNNDNTWSDQEASLSIIVRPPWWGTLLVRIGSIVFVISLVLGFYYFRLYRLRRQKSLLETKVQERTNELYEANAKLQERQKEVMVQNLELEKHRNNLEQLVHERTRELEGALGRARESDQLKSAFLANMSHEIRTPMNAIVGFSSLIDDPDLSPKDRKDFIDLIRANSESLLMLINDILDLSLIEANQIVIRKESFHLNEMTDQIFSYFRYSNKKTALEIRLNHALAADDLVLYTDKSRLKQILSNFMSNACKFTDSGFVELGIAKENDRLKLYVQDTGIGIAKEDMQHLFERFRKLGEGTTSSARGAGLGLAISKRVADHLGGTIEVQSEPGAGSVFMVTFPYATIVTTKTVQPEISKTMRIKDWRNKNILIVEDEDANYLYLRRICEKTHASVVWAENGREAVNQVESGAQYDLILMDIKMPEMDGIETMKRLKANKPEQLIVAQTAYASAEDEVMFRQQGFDDYLAKPISFSDLLHILEKYF